jgi:CheY-like chemotaxis protein
MTTNANFSKSILIVDDDIESLSYLKLQLEDAGYTAEINASIEIIDLLKVKRFDLICIDMMILGYSINSTGEKTQNIRFDNIRFEKTGLEFYRQLRAGAFTDPHYSGTPVDVPVIFLSAITSEILNEAGINDKKLMYLEKPFMLKELLSYISKLIN